MARWDEIPCVNADKGCRMTFWYQWSMEVHALQACRFKEE
jgi:hypothetical protein